MVWNAVIFPFGYQYCQFVSELRLFSFSPFNNVYSLMLFAVTVVRSLCCIYFVRLICSGELSVRMHFAKVKCWSVY